MLSKLIIKHNLVLIFLILIQLIANASSFSSKTRFLRFESEPESVYTELNKKIHLKCLAKPKKSRIEWLINEEPVRIDDSAIFTTVDSLIIQLPERIDQNVGQYTFDELINGSIQCKAEFKNQVLLSQPAKVIVAYLNDFPFNEDEIKVDIKEQQIAVIPCRPPNSPPKVVTNFLFKNKLIESNDEKYHLMPSGSLQIFNVSMEDSGKYQCIAYNPWLKEKKNSTSYVTLHVEKQFQNNDDSYLNQDRFAIQNLNFLTTPKQKYSVIRGTEIQIFECVASSILPVSINWFREDRRSMPKNRFKIVGGNLVVNNVQTSDQGVYYCEATNGHKTIAATSELEVKQTASIRTELESKQVRIGEQVELECAVNGNPLPKINWYLNGLKLTSSNLDQLDARIDRLSDDISKLIIKKTNEQQHNGIVQCFASNDLLTVYSVAKLDVISELNNSSSIGNNNNDNLSVSSKQPTRTRSRSKSPKNRSKSDMAIPNKPKIIRLSFDSVVVYWKMPKKNRLPIVFFKIQYKDAHLVNNTIDWITVEEDIPPNINSFSVTNLQSDRYYKFRIMAVYKNQDSQDGRVSDQFFLAKNPIVKRPSLIPQIIEGKSDGSNSIEIYWECKFVDDKPIDGFLIHYRPTQSAEIYHKITIDSNKTRAFTIEHLAQSKQYDVKIQSFNLGGVSDFSRTETVRTLPALGVDEETEEEEKEELPDLTLPDSSKEDENRYLNHPSNVNFSTTSTTTTTTTTTTATLIDNEPKGIESTSSKTSENEQDNSKSSKIDPLFSTQSPLFYVIIGIIILINLIILVYCYAIMKRWINRNKDKKAKADDKFDLDDENFVLKPVEEESMNSFTAKMNIFNEPLYSNNGGVLSSNPHLTRKAIKSYNHNYATIGHGSKNMFNKNDVYDSSLMNVRINKFCDDSNLANSLLAINKTGGVGNQITRRDLPLNHRMSTSTIHNLTRPNFVANNQLHNHHTIQQQQQSNHLHNNIHNKNLLLPETNLKAITHTLGRHRPTTRNFEDLYGTNTHFATINRSNSIARLNNGTLERNKRKTRESRNDLFTVLKNLEESGEPTTIVDLQQSPNNLRINGLNNLQSVRFVNNNLSNLNNSGLNLSAMNGTLLNNSNLTNIGMINNHHHNLTGMTSITNLNGNENSIYNTTVITNLNNTSLNSNMSSNMNNSLNNYEQLQQNSPRSAYGQLQQQHANLPNLPSLPNNTANTNSNASRPVVVGIMQSSC